MPVFSHSRLETYETCPQKYKFRHIDQILKPEEQTVEAFVGSRVHETLHKLYRDLQLTKLTPLDELIEYYAERWKANWSSTIKKDELVKLGHYPSRATCTWSYVPLPVGRLNRQLVGAALDL